MTTFPTWGQGRLPSAEKRSVKRNETGQGKRYWEENRVIKEGAQNNLDLKEAGVGKREARRN